MRRSWLQQEPLSIARVQITIRGAGAQIAEKTGFLNQT
jgi:hypothetical protein